MNKSKTVNFCPQVATLYCATSAPRCMGYPLSSLQVCVWWGQVHSPCCWVRGKMKEMNGNCAMSMTCFTWELGCRPNHWKHMVQLGLCYVMCWCARIFESKLYLVSCSCTNTDRRCSTCGFLGHKSTGRIPSAPCWWSRSIFSLSYASPGPQITYILFKWCSSTVKTSSHGHRGLLV